MRRLPPDPLSTRAVWARRFAWFAATVTVMGVLAMRSGILPYQQSVVVLGAGAMIASIGFLLAIAALVQIWNIGARGLSKALSGFFLSLVLLIAPAALAVQAARTPVLHDISTDLDQPPEFSRENGATAARNGTVPPVSGPAERALQRQYYPDIQPALLDMPEDEAMPVLDSTVEAMGWRVIARQAPSPRGAPGRIDAVESSLILRLPDDIAIRITPQGDQTRIDIRSVSRFGGRDFGANARRVRNFLAELQSQARSR